MLTVLLLSLLACGGAEPSAPATPAAPAAPTAPAEPAAPAAPAAAAAADCCCGLNPTDVGQIVYERLAPDVCTAGGPERRYDGGACVEDTKCVQAAANAVCCCGLNPTDVGQIVYERLAPDVCTAGGPERRYDGGACVEDMKCL